MKDNVNVTMITLIKLFNRYMTGILFIDMLTANYQLIPFDLVCPYLSNETA